MNRNPDRRHPGQRDLFWLLLVPVISLTALVVRAAAPHLVPIAAKEDIGRLFLAFAAAGCAPEGLEQARYQLAVLAPVAFMVIAMVLARRLGAPGEDGPPPAWAGTFALLSQSAVLAVAAFAFVYEFLRGYRYFDEVIAGGLLLALIATGAFFHRPVDRAREQPPARAKFAGAWVAWALAATWTAVSLLGCIFTDANISRANAAVIYHLDYTMGEFAAVLNGRRPLVDLFPQYQNLTPYLLAPIFKIVGFNVTTYTTLMCVMSWTGFVLVFSTFTRVAGSPWKALALYVPFVAASVCAVASSPGGQVLNPFNYYAMGPLRYFGLFLVAFAVSWYLAAPRLGRLIALSALSGAVALNNLDFGVPAAAGALVAGLLFPPERFGRRLAPRILGVIAVFSCSAAASLGLYCVAVRVASGGWPSLGMLTLFQRAFALYGFYMLPLPRVGLYWVVYLTLMAAVLVPLYETWGGVGGEASRERRLLNGMLAYGGVSGLGALFYYIGRSHAQVLSALLGAWSFVVVLLACRAWREWRDSRGCDPSQGKRSLILAVCPALAVFVLYSLIASTAFRLPDPRVQWKRLASAATAPDVGARKVSLISRYVRPGEPTVIVSAQAHWLALRAGVDNRYPFTHEGSLLLKQQIDVVMERVGRLPRGHGYVFATGPAELKLALARAGYVQREGEGDFAVWAPRAAEEQGGSAAIATVPRER